MQKIKIRLPATITNLGPGLNSLGLAVGLYTTVDISGRNDEALNFQAFGEGAEAFETPLKHPVVLALARFFQELERTHLGINIRVENQIPLKSGLGAETAFAVAGVLGANNLLGDLYKRDELLEIAATITRPDGVAAALLGGLSIGIMEDDSLLYRTLAVKPFQLVIVTPKIDNYAVPPLPEQIPRHEALHNLSRLPLLLEALRLGDVKLLATAIDDHLLTPRLAERISGYRILADVARNRGALAVTTCGNGPSVVALTEANHRRIGEDMVAAFKSVGVEARYWVLPIDTQGVVISAMQSA